MVPRQAVILVGGLGTRLGGLTQQTPKPLLPIGGQPFVTYLLRNLRRFGFDRFVLLAGHLGEMVEATCGSSSDFARTIAAEIEVLREPAPLGTGGAVKAASSALDPYFLLLNGDSLFDFNVLSLTSPLGSDVGRVALRRLEEPSRYGVVDLRAGCIMGFEERPSRPGPAFVNSGVYFLRKDILGAIPDGVCSLERDVFPALAKSARLAGKVFDGFFIDIGIPADLERAQISVPAAMRRPAVFFDRDGVLNHDDGYTHRVEDFRWIEGAPEAIRRCNEAGYYVFVVTNQAGVARGLYDEAAVDSLHRWMNESLRAFGAHIDDFRYCPHHPEGTIAHYARTCSCRKPEPGMLFSLMEDWPIDRALSFLIGDKISDMAAAQGAGVSAFAYEGGSLDRLIASVIGSQDVKIEPTQ